MEEKSRPLKLLITTGEPAGIGPEICLQWLAQRIASEKKDALSDIRFVLVGDKEMLRERASSLSIPVTLVDYDSQQENLSSGGDIEVWHTPLFFPAEPGKLAVDNGRYVLNTLDIAITACMNKQFDAVVTAPIHKGVINDAGVPFTGHTEYLAEKSNTARVVMMLAGEALRVALVTTHLPLRKVPDAITQSLILEVLSILNHDLTYRFGIRYPKILVTGLNPHAGEEGHLGTEERDIIAPALAEAQRQGICCEGPIPADTAFLPEKLAHADAILAMYHDQGLATLKYATFGQGANITLGLPFIRTSVDHGCALSLAGKGVANLGSLETAIYQALLMTRSERLAEH